MVTVCAHDLWWRSVLTIYGHDLWWRSVLTIYGHSLRSSLVHTNYSRSTVTVCANDLCLRSAVMIYGHCLRSVTVCAHYLRSRSVLTISAVTVYTWPFDLADISDHPLICAYYLTLTIYADGLRSRSLHRDDLYQLTCVRAIYAIKVVMYWSLHLLLPSSLARYCSSSPQSPTLNCPQPLAILSMPWAWSSKKKTCHSTKEVIEGIFQPRGLLPIGL